MITRPMLAATPSGHGVSVRISTHPDYYGGVENVTPKRAAKIAMDLAAKTRRRFPGANVSVVSGIIDGKDVHSDDKGAEREVIDWMWEAWDR